MTIQQLRAKLRADMAARLATRNSHAGRLAELREAETTDQAAVDEVRAAMAALDAELDVLQARDADLAVEEERDQAAQRLAEKVTAAPLAPAAQARSGAERIHVGDEPRTYTPDTARAGVSFFRDAFNMLQGDMSARSRIERHSTEVRVEGEASERAASTSSFAGMIVPQYLIDQAALVARAGRPYANVITRLPLPDHGMSIVIPRGTTGASAAIQAAENSAVSSTDEVWTNVTCPVVTISGQQDVSRQSLDRGAPGLDALIYMDLAAAYAVALDAQCLSGTGAAGQVLGVLSTAGINQATAFTAAANAATFYSKTAGQVNAVETTRFLAPTHIVMHPRRWNWLLSQVDASNRPLAIPSGQGPNNATATYDGHVDTPSSSPVGQFLGLPVITDALVPTAVGTGPEDQVLVVRALDHILWEEGNGMPRELRFEQTLGNQLTVKLVVAGYAAFTAGRFPTSTGVVGGNAGTAGFGLVAPTF